MIARLELVEQPDILDGDDHLGFLGQRDGLADLLWGGLVEAILKVCDELGIFVRDPDRDLLDRELTVVANKAIGDARGLIRRPFDQVKLFSRYRPPE